MASVLRWFLESMRKAQQAWDAPLVSYGMIITSAVLLTLATQGHVGSPISAAGALSEVASLRAARHTGGGRSKGTVNTSLELVLIDLESPSFHKDTNPQKCTAIEKIDKSG